MSRLTPRWLRNISCILLTAPAVVFTGCSTPGPGVVQISPDTYVVRMQNRNGIFVTDEPNLKAQAVGQAMDFAESRGKVALPVTMSEDTVTGLTDWSKIEYRFKLVDKSDPRAKQTTIATGRDGVDKKDDVYAELMKLDELRKKGILTEAEFTSEKQKLLNRPK